MIRAPQTKKKKEKKHKYHKCFAIIFIYLAPKYILFL